MARIVNKSQQVIARGIAPRPAYTRVVSIIQSMNPDGEWYVGVTPQLGMDLWLLAIDLWTTEVIPAANFYTDFTFHIGQGKTGLYEEVRHWEQILPITYGMATASIWRITDGNLHQRWTMKRRFTTQARRLAVCSRRGLTMGVAVILVSFEISEG